MTAAIVAGDAERLGAEEGHGRAIGNGVPGVLKRLVLLLGAHDEVGGSDIVAVAGGGEELAGDVGPRAVGGHEIVKVIMEAVARLDGDELIVAAGDLKDVA